MSDVNYHAWTHRTKFLGGTDPLPTMPWARISKGFDASNQTISNNTNTDLTFNHSYNMATGESGARVFSTSGTTGLTALAHGVYLVTAEVYWLSSITTAWMLAISNSDAWFHSHYFMGQSSQDVHGSVSLPLRIDPTATYSATVWQASGSAKDVDAMYLEMIYLGDFNGTERADMNPNQ